MLLLKDASRNLFSKVPQTVDSPDQCGRLYGLRISALFTGPTPDENGKLRRGVAKLLKTSALLRQYAKPCALLVPLTFPRAERTCDGY